jgi:undecaprenyl diphosphate synthase
MAFIEPTDQWGTRNDAPASIDPALHCDPTLPRHVGIIMDGNGRWAQRRWPRLEGTGRCRAFATSPARRELGIEALTLYAFSSQNWARP